MSAVPREQCGVEFCLVCSEDPSVCEECEEGYRLDDPTNCIVIEDEGVMDWMMQLSLVIQSVTWLSTYFITQGTE